MQINRGSEWRRWELHLHTPFTKKQDHYKGETPSEKWDNFYTTIANYIGDGTDPMHSICAIAITDYLSIDNFLKVCSDKRLPDSIKLVMPNVELRMKPVASDSPINIHCIFDPSIAGELESRFFANLKFEYRSNHYSATKSELIRFGRDFQSDQHIPEDEAYKIGLDQYVISVETLTDIFKNNPQLREKTIIVVSNKSNDGASGLRAHSDYFAGSVSQLEATRRAIYQLSDMIYSANPKDIAYFLGEGGMDAPDVVQEKCGSLKPCIHGCDAHCNAKVFAPDHDRFCWIKADPTFEGFKQVLYEPRERVRISSTIPDTKPGYYVIDRVEIPGNENFSPEPLYFSDKLTCIIGGKSTGKSLLLHNMAMAIDLDQVKRKEETAATNVKQIPKLKVYWRDGICSGKDKQRKIVYIPQTYLNRLSDEEQETTEIDTIIQEIVLQDEKCHEAYRLMNRKIAEKKQEVAKTIVDFLKIVSDRKTISDKCKAIGDEDSICSEIEGLTAQLEQLSKEYNVTEEEIANYQHSVEKIQSQKGVLSAISKEMAFLKEITSVVEVRPLTTNEITIYSTSMSRAVEKVKEIADTTWLAEREAIIKDAYEQQNQVEASLKEQEEIVATLRPKMDGNERIRKLSATIISAKERLSQLTEYHTQLEAIQEQYNEHLRVLSQSFAEFSEIYLGYTDAVNDGFVSSSSDLEFSVKKVLRLEQLSQRILGILDNRSIGRFTTFDLRNITEDTLCPEHITAFIESLLINSSTSLQIKSNYNIESALREILTDWYNVDYVIKMDNDNIQDMSPGKKALVLLRLLISLAESSCPILVDQPEDDLDNRSIFNELIRFIKEKKVDRQIIVVTHNANIVLGGDAELVIVANQNGRNAPNKQFRFEYRGGAIEDNSPVFTNGVLVPGILSCKGIQEHICEILEGGEQAFELRQHKYHFIRK